MKNNFLLLLKFLKKEIVFTIAAFLAIVSFIVVKPGIRVCDGIDFRTLVLLFSLMSVVSGLQRQFMFEKTGNYIIGKVTNSKILIFFLVLICFISSMVLTNDVALITFVPFSVMILPMAGEEDKLILTVVLQTLAANLGSVLTPLGNPQNLYLYNISGMSAGEFVSFMFPLWIVSFFLVMVPVLFMKGNVISKANVHSTPKGDVKKQVFYLVLFILCLLCVLKVLDYRILFGIVVASILVFDRKALIKVDYILLLTFVGFFIFIYDMKQIPAVVSWISSVVVGREFLVGILSSQVISNVPAAILLSGFTDNLKTLLLSVDVAGMGTLIASMASLISYKLYGTYSKSKPGKYIFVFTLFNIVYLIITYVFCVLWYHI